MKKKDFIEQMRLQEKEKRLIRKHSTADSYRASRNWFICFVEGREISLKDVTAEMVHTFQAWLEQKDLKVNTINSYLSCFRAMYHRACSFQKGWKEPSPFADLHLKREETCKRAAPVEVIKEIALLDLEEDPELQLTADLALFTFFACGIPFVDAVHLTAENLVEKGTILQYRRQKTGELIRMEVSKEMRRLLDRYRNTGSRYLFPVLPEDATHSQYKSCIAAQNSGLKELSRMLHLSEPLTTYSFRHAWASEAYHRHVPIGVISQALGHTSERTTRIYLSAFDVSEVSKANRTVSDAVEGYLKAV